MLGLVGEPVTQAPVHEPRLGGVGQELADPGGPRLGEAGLARARILRGEALELADSLACVGPGLVPPRGIGGRGAVAPQQEGAGGEGGVGLQDLLRVQDAGVEERVVGQRRPDGLLGLADLLGLVDEALGQVVGDVEGEVAADDGDARGGGHGAGALFATQVPEEHVALGGPLVALEIGGREGEGVVAAGEDGDVVAPQDDGDDRDDGALPLRRAGVGLRPLRDVRPGLGEGLGDSPVEAVVDGEDEAPQGVGVVARTADGP